jgi:hypothetical protein
MPSFFPCPNAQCSYQFDADQLPAAAMVTCPLCHNRFPYRAGRPISTDEPRPAGPRMVKLRNVPQGGGVLTTVLWVGGFLIVLAGVLAAITLRGLNTSSDSSAKEALDEKFNLKVEPFPTGWANDPNPPASVDRNILLRKRSNPDGWVAVAARDWGDRQPRAGELDEYFRGRLRIAFRTLETEPVEGQTWAGQPATAVRFTGNLDDFQVRGEAFAMAHKGIGYVFVAWAAEPNWAALRDELVGLKEKVRPAGFRDAWSEKRASALVYEGNGFQIEDVDGAWLLRKPAEDGKRPKHPDDVLDDVKAIDPAAVMALIARYQIRERGDALRLSPVAHALVVELAPKGDPLETAKAHAMERVKRDFADGPPEGLALEPLTKSPSGVALPTSGPAIGRFRLKNPKATGDEELWVISALVVGDKVIAVEANVLAKNASYVEEWMINLAGSLKAK